MNIFDRIFGKKKSVDTTHTTDLNAPTLEDFTKLSSDNRILALMKFGDSKQIDISHFPFFQFAILSDQDKNVKFAALKRIHAFKEHPDTISMMKKLMTENKNDDLEPYFSMALSRLGLISLEDFEKKINNSK